ncbi:NAD(P)-dependent dehydrogenase (short-subunit alcohol dehydrogenase family) [Rhizobium sp. BK529]|nr:SDR family oxidoreductase [Rhizobium sp. BK529]MBB3595222.1 NAD(P)-dependent dehydrogenase (short-subunit alcohol dehydrogenase family) [Rhizobium sp. BK529]
MRERWVRFIVRTINRRNALGHLDILFVNAGVAQFGPVESWSEADFDRSFATNVKGPYFLIQALIPIFSKSASIVLNTSINAQVGRAGRPGYSRQRRQPRTDRDATLREARHVGSGDEGNVQKQIPVGRFGDVSEVAKTVVFFASDEAAYIVGSELVIDGGMSNL